MTTVYDLSENLRQTIREYTDGQYSKYCEYTQYIANGSADISPSLFTRSKELWEKDYLPKITQKEREDAEEILNVILSQPVSNDPLLRLERGTNNLRVGDTLKFGIRSTSSDSGFIDSIIEQSMEGLEYDLLDKNNNGDWTEWRFLSSKSLDISEISVYKDQKERLIAGTYEIVSVDTVEAEKPDWKAVSIKMSDVAEDVQHFVSKKGNEMVRYKYDGKEMTDTVDKFNTRTIEDYVETKGVFGRRIITVRVKDE